MDARDLTVSFDDALADSLLSEWHWLLGNQQLPVMVTALGDVFVQDLASGAISYLNTASADLILVAESVDDLSCKLADDDFINEYFAPEFVALLQQRNGELAEGMLYGLRIPEQLGGDIELEDMQICDLQQHFALWGRAHAWEADAI